MIRQAERGDQFPKGIGPAIAGHIVEARKGGAFKDWPDFIERVKGVGEHNAVEKTRL